MARRRHDARLHGYDRFHANVFGTFVRFGFSNVLDEGYGIVEQLAADAFIAFYGTADATVEAGAASIEGPLSGSLRIVPAREGRVRVILNARSSRSPVRPRTIG